MRLIALLILLIPGAALAQVPGKLAYQGRLLNADGTPVQGTESMQFSIFAAASGGTALWTETQTVAVDDGFYSVVLGDVTALPSTVFTGTERYLELTVGTSTLSPRQRIDSVAYALLSQGLAGATSCSSGQVPKWTGSGWSCGDDANSGGSVSSVTGAAPISVTAGATPTVSIGQASGTANGYLSSTDWNTFNSKQAAIQSTCTAGQYIQGINVDGTVNCGDDASNAGTVTRVTASAPLSVASGTTTPALSLSKASASSDGYLSSTDWNTFNTGASSGVPSGMIMFFDGIACPSGWTAVAAAQGRYLVGLIPGETAGSAVGTALTANESRATGAHTHAVNDPGHSHSITDPGHTHNYVLDEHTANSGSSGNWSNGPFQTAATSLSYTGISINTAQTGITVGAVNSGSAPAGTNAPYLEYIVCRKN